MKHKSLYALIALAIAGGVATGKAQAVDYSNWYLAPRIGVVIPDSHRQTQNSLLGGFGVGFWVNSNFAADIQYTITNADYKNSSPFATRQWETQGLDVAGRYFFGTPDTNWRPFLMGSIGAVSHRAFMAQDGWGPAVAVGVGVQHALSDNIALRGEVDYRRNRDTVSIPGRASYGDVLATLGLVISMNHPAPPPPTPAPVVAPPPPPPAAQPPAPQKVVIELRGVQFQFDRPRPGQTNLNGILDKPVSDSVAILDQAADTLKRYPDTQIQIDGYTDSIGSQAYNMKLSDRRAEFVAKYLTAHGVPASQISGTKGFGKDDPVASNATAEGRERNRRVEFKVQNAGSMEQPQQ